MVDKTVPPDDGCTPSAGEVLMSMPPLPHQQVTVEPAWPAVLGGLAGAVVGFSTFGVFLFANVYVDGRPDADFVEVALSAVAMCAWFWVPAGAAVWAASARSRATALRAFAVTELAFAAFFLIGCVPCVALAVGAGGLTAAWRSLRAGRLRGPNLFAVAVLVPPAMLLFAAWAESHR